MRPKAAGRWGGWAAAAASARWQDLLHRRLDESYLIDTGILDGSNLRSIVKGHISGAVSAPHLLTAWLTLEEWFGQYQ